MEEWKEYKIGDVCNITSSKRIFASEYNTFGIPFYRGKEIIEKQRGSSISNELFISEERYKEINAKYGTPSEGDMLLTSVGTLGIPYIVENNEVFYFKDGNLTWFNNFKGINNKYLYYWFLSPKAKHFIDTKAIGSTQKALTIDTLKNFDIQLPSIGTQEKIVSILSSIDSKITLNRRINDNLELQAQALYKSWFVDFEPFKDGKFVDSELGMIPEGWSIGDIGTYSKVRSGFAFKSSWWTQSGSKVIKIKNITSDYRLDMTECSFVSKDNTAKASEFRVEVGDLLIAMTGATIGKFCLITSSDNNTYVNQRVGKFFLGNEPLKRLPFLYCCLKQDSVINEIINKGQGSAQPNISGTDIESIKIVLPNDETIPIFNEHLYPMYKMIIKNQEEIELLSTMRDSILPKLMSGELKVNDLNN
jgi:type I restriction enzyme S subunit